MVMIIWRKLLFVFILLRKKIVTRNNLYFENMKLILVLF